MKKIKPPVRKAAVWVDQEDAYIFHVEGNNELNEERLRSGVESRIRNKGEGKVSARFGNSYIDDKEKKQRRQRNQRSHYFKEIIEKISNADQVYLFGPGRGKEELNNAIEKAHAFKGKVMAIDTADQMTPNQMLEKVKEYFSRELKTAVN